MRRLLSITAFALFLAVPLWAQHGGGGHGGGSGGHGGGGFSGGHASGGGHASSGFSGGVHSNSGGVHTGSGSARAFSRPSFSTRGSSRGPFLHDGFRGSFRTYGFRNNCYGYACRGYGYPWGYGGYYDPYWLWDSGSNYDDSYNQDVAAAADMNRQNLEEQQMLRQEEADGDQDAYARPSSRAPRSNMNNSDDVQGAAILPPTVLIFRDQHKQEINNYAIVGQTLWSFAPGQTKKIPLADLDISSTVKANEDRGMTFRIPAAPEGQ
jgi:hypothetical protein